MHSTLRRWRDGNAVEVWEAHKVAVQTVLKLPSGELFTGRASDMSSFSIFTRFLLLIYIGALVPCTASAIYYFHCFLAFP